MAYQYSRGYQNPFDDYENYDQQGLRSTAQFAPQMNGPTYDLGGYEKYPAPQTGLRAGNAIGYAGDAVTAVNPALGIGLKAAGSVANWLGDGYGRKVRKEGMNRLRGMYGKPVINVGGLTAYRRKASYGDAQRLGQQADQRFGLDTGRGFGWFSNNLLEGIDKGAADAYYQNELETARRDLAIAQAGANYGR